MPSSSGSPSSRCVCACASPGSSPPVFRSTTRPRSWSEGADAVPRAYVGLGSNLGDREAMLERAVELLAADPDVEFVAVSSTRETDPVGYIDQPRFLNAAVAVATEVSARTLLERLLGIERELGRTRGGRRYGQRVIDLDL